MSCKVCPVVFNVCVLGVTDMDMRLRSGLPNRCSDPPQPSKAVANKSAKKTKQIIEGNEERVRGMILLFREGLMSSSYIEKETFLGNSC